jgi:hypothetical protein
MSDTERERIEVDCPRAKTSMTPCVARDGKSACADDGVCVGCGYHPANLLKELVIKYVKLLDEISKTGYEKY